MLSICSLCSLLLILPQRHHTQADHHLILSYILRNLLPAYAKTKAQISCTESAQLISAFVFYYIDSTIPLLPKSDISSHLLWLYNSVCVGPGQKPLRQVFTHCRSSTVHKQDDETHDIYHHCKSSCHLAARPLWGRHRCALWEVGPVNTGGCTFRC